MPERQQAAHVFSMLQAHSKSHAAPPHVCSTTKARCTKHRHPPMGGSTHTSILAPPVGMGAKCEAAYLH